MGVDIVVGEGQLLGVGLQFGGLYVGLFVCKEKFVCQMLGCLCGEMVDVEGKCGFVLILFICEQYICCEKVMLNICINFGLCVLVFSIYMMLLGEKGLCEFVVINYVNVCVVVDWLIQILGVELVNISFFNEFMLKLLKEVCLVVCMMVDKGVLGGVLLGWFYFDDGVIENGFVVVVIEMVSVDDIEIFVVMLVEVLV